VRARACAVADRELTRGEPSLVAVRPLPLVFGLLAVYVAALLIFPADFGLRAIGVVWTPARLALVALVAALVATRQLTLVQLRNEHRSLLVCWFAFLGAATVTALINPFTGSLARLLSLALEGFGLFLAVRSVAGAPDAARGIVRVAVAATLLVVSAALVLGVFELRYDTIFATLGGQTLPPNLSGDRFGLVRQQGSFPAALFFAVWIATSSVLVLPWTESPDGRMRMVGVAVWIVLLIGVAVLTVSRIGVTVTFVAAGVYLLLRGRRAVGAGAVICGLALALGLAGLSIGTPASTGVGTNGPNTNLASPGTSSSPNQPTYPSESDILAGSNELRVKALHATVMAVAQRPLFGWGLLSARSVVATIGGSPNYVDSSYLAMAVEMGLVGLATFLALTVAVAITGFPARLSADGLSLLIALGALLGMSVVAAYFNVTQGYSTLWLLAALLLAHRSPELGVVNRGAADAGGLRTARRLHG
jgi:O-antigen ligase/polysaccharide polymerase Wzy-like membrane protein